MPRRRPGVLLPLELAILDVGTTLQAAEGSFFGFGLARALAGRDGSALLAHGTLYKALNRMAEAGLLEAEWEAAEPAEVAGRPRRRLYRVTGAGEAALRASERAAAIPSSVTRPVIA
jgi:PadR family transcriptional regulator, regulatory protein PadR